MDARQGFSGPQRVGDLLRKPTYSEKLRDPRWQKRRLERLDASGWKCDRCGDHESELQVHHRWYLKNMDPWDYGIQQLETLCANCHKNASKVHSEMKRLLSTASVGTQSRVLRLLFACRDVPCKVTFDRSRESENTPQAQQRVAAALAHATCECPSVVGKVRSMIDHKGSLMVHSFFPLSAREQHAFRYGWEQCGEHDVEFHSDSDEPFYV